MNFKHNRLRPGPRTTFEYGRHEAACQVTARALVALLRPYGIRWRAVTLHDSNLHGSHGTLEVAFERGRGVVDPLFALIYRHPDGSSFQARRPAPV